MKLGLAIKTMFRVLGNDEFATRIKSLLSGESIEQTMQVPAPTRRSEALTMLATLQRDSRFLDFVMESFDGWDDMKVGAAAQDMQRDCRATIMCIFDIQPLTNKEENAPIEVPAGFDPEEYRLTGKVGGEAPFKGILRYHGWKAGCCDVPEWTGRDDLVMTVSPMEVEIY